MPFSPGFLLQALLLLLLLITIIMIIPEKQGENIKDLFIETIWFTAPAQCTDNAFLQLLLMLFVCAHWLFEVLVSIHSLFVIWY